MKDDKRPAGAQTPPGSLPNRILGSLRDALNAASRDDRTGEMSLGGRPDPASGKAALAAQKAAPPAAGAAGRPLEGQVPALQSTGGETKALTREPKPIEAADPTTQLKRAAAPALKPAVPLAVDAAKIQAAKIPPPHTPATNTSAPDTQAPKTQAVRGKPKVLRNNFLADPVVGWLVVVGGPGLGSFRPIFEGNNAVGRSKDQRIPIDFGDTTISSEEQAYIRYDSADRAFLFVPNLSKTNIVAINDKKPTGAVKLELMDVITMGRTQLAFVPFCGEEFDWSELSDLKE
ncbi:MAG TPA: FHA domain-containing protein [Hyphomicrobiaceae bacterium]|nr:FHA domain-containing protein [Hyphomicrobiaceae bacterium]